MNSTGPTFVSQRSAITVNFFCTYNFFLGFYAPSHTDFYKFHIASLKSDSKPRLSRRSAHHVSRALFSNNFRSNSVNIIFNMMRRKISIQFYSKKKLRPWFLIFQQNEKNAYVSLSRHAVAMRPYSKTEPANETFWKHVQKNSPWRIFFPVFTEKNKFFENFFAQAWS